MQTGRPSSFNSEIANEICDVISYTPKSLAQLCQENPHWPDRSCIRKWVVKYPEFGAQYARAKMIQVEFYVEDAIEVAKNAEHDTYKDDKGKKKCDHEWVQRSRLIVDTFKWYASKLAPKIYGDKIHVTKDAEDDSLDKAKEKAKEMLSNGQ